MSSKIMTISSVGITFLVAMVFSTLQIKAQNISECWLVANNSFRDTIGGLNSDYTKLLWITIMIDGNEIDMIEQELRGVFMPNKWAIPISSEGRNHLQMAAWQQIGFVNLLNLRLGEFDISTSVISEPQYCFYNKSAEEKLVIIRNSLFNHLKFPVSSSMALENINEICNGAVVGSDYNNRIAVLAYHCCKQTKTGKLDCHIMKTGIWIELLGYYFWIVCATACIVNILLVMTTNEKDRPVNSNTKYQLLRNTQVNCQHEPEFNLNSNNVEDIPNLLSMKIDADQIQDNKMRPITFDYLLLYILKNCIGCKSDCRVQLYRKMRWIIFIFFTVTIFLVRIVIVDPSLTSHFQALANAAERNNMTEKYDWTDVNSGMNICAMISACINFILWVFDIIVYNTATHLNSTRQVWNQPAGAYPTFFQYFGKTITLMMKFVHFLTVLVMTFYICTHIGGTVFFTTVEILANAGITLQGVTLGLIFMMHCYKAYLELNTTYKDFHKNIETKILEVCKKDKISEEDNYRAFLVVAACDGKEFPDKETMQVHGILVYPKRYLSKEERTIQFKQPEENVVLQIVRLPFFKCPGSISSNIIMAGKKLLVTGAVLLFIFLVVKAYGDASELSMTNQLLAMIIAAFIPFWSGCFFTVANKDYLEQKKCILHMNRKAQKCNLAFKIINRSTNQGNHERTPTEQIVSRSSRNVPTLPEYDFLSRLTIEH